MKKHLFTVGAIVCFMASTNVKSMKWVPQGRDVREGFGCHYYSICDREGVFDRENKFSKSEEKNWKLALTMVPFLISANEINNLVDEIEDSKKLLLEPEELVEFLHSLGSLVSSKKDEFLYPLKKFVAHYKISKKRLFFLTEKELAKDKSYDPKKSKKHLTEFFDPDLKEVYNMEMLSSSSLYDKNWSEDWQEIAEECQKKGEVRLAEYKVVLKAIEYVLRASLMKGNLSKLKKLYRKSFGDKRKSRGKRKSLKKIEKNS